MPRRLSRPAAGLLVALAAALLALPACDKKKPTQPDSTPPPDPTSGPGPDNTPTNPNQQSDPSLPSPPTQRPMFASGVLSAQQKAGSENNLSQIALAFHNFHDERNGFPAGVAAKSGKIGLSWRVAILPQLGQGALYNQFKLDEPWDSENNKKLILKMPAVYAPPRTDTNGYTFYQSFSGPGTLMQPPTGPLRPGQPVVGTRITGIPDGTSNTFMVAEAYNPVIWTKPEDLPFAPGKPPRLGGGLFGNGFHVALCDGSVKFLGTNVSPQTVAACITINGGEAILVP